MIPLAALNPFREKSPAVPEE